MGPVNRSIGGGWRRFGAALARALLPPRCLLCGEPGSGDRDLCAACHAELPWNHPACPHCALPLGAGGAACGRCLASPPPYDACLAPLRYAAPADRLLQRLKFHGDLAAGRLLSQLMLERHGALLADAVDAVVPVPLHPRRLGRRGYNQALELARPLARALGRPLLADALRRERATGPQTELDAAARRRNVRGAFVAAGAAPARVVLVDDTLTTGATVAECARVLRAAGAREVRAWVAARTP